MGPVQATKTCFRKLLDFSGRASRSEFWWYWVAATLVITGAGTVAVIIGLPTWLTGAATIAILAPMPAAAARHAQDAGTSRARLGLFAAVFFGAAILMDLVTTGMVEAGGATQTSIVALISLWAIGFIFLSFVFVWLRRPSQSGPNKYGPNPHEVTP